MITYVCFSDLEGVPLTEECRDDSYYLSYLFVELEKPIGEYKYWAYPLYSSEENIPKEHKYNGHVKKIRVKNFDVYKSIRKRERVRKEIENIFDNLFSNVM